MGPVEATALPLVTSSVVLACGGILPGVVYAALVGAQRVRRIAVMSMQTRRGALHVGMAALTAGASASVPPFAALRAPGPADAELIRLCGLWQAVDRELEAYCDTRATIEIEQHTQADFDRFLERLLKIGNEIEKYLPPKTEAGAAVIATLALEAANKWNGDYQLVPDICHRMAWDALAFFFCTESKSVAETIQNLE